MHGMHPQVMAAENLDQIWRHGSIRGLGYQNTFGGQAEAVHFFPFRLGAQVTLLDGKDSDFSGQECPGVPLAASPCVSGVKTRSLSNVTDGLTCMSRSGFFF